MGPGLVAVRSPILCIMCDIVLYRLGRSIYMEHFSFVQFMERFKLPLSVWLEIQFQFHLILDEAGSM